jgi:tRNA A-37 threonylcarbamoyl transferase component Bud32
MWLSIKNGADRGKTLRVTEAGVLVGRDPTSDLPLADEKVSRSHAKLTVQPDGRVLLSDLGSTNGTFVDGNRIVQPVVLRGDERLRFGDTEVETSSGDPAVAPPRPKTKDPWIGTTIASKYRIIDKIAEGGMGVVYLAERLLVGDKVALKLLAPRLARDPRFRQRFEEEWRRAAALRHPNILQVWDVGSDEQEQDLLYIVMPYIDGGDLGSLLESVGVLSPARALSILSDVAAGLDKAHAMGLVHRDVKPTNILIERTAEGLDHAYLCDFGIAKIAAATSGLTAPGQTVGTVHYMAPEQIRGEPHIDGRADEYSLGCVLYECLTGELPFDNEDPDAIREAHVKSPPPRVTARRPELPKALDAVVAKAMAKAKEDRYPTCVGMIEAARAAFTGEQATAKPQEAQGDATEVGGAPPAGPTRAGDQATAAGVPDDRGPTLAAAPLSFTQRYRNQLLVGGVVAIVVILALILSSVMGGGGSKPLSDARLAGTFSVSSILTKTSFTDETVGQSDTYSFAFAPDCPSGPCDTSLSFETSGGTITVHLNQQGESYAGTGFVDGTCQSTDVSVPVVVTVRVNKGDSIAGAWRAATIAGTLAEDYTQVSACTSSDLRTLTGTLQG